MCPLQRWPEFFARTMFLTDIFHGVNHKCSDEFKYHAHLLRDKSIPFIGGTVGLCVAKEKDYVRMDSSPFLYYSRV
jgi:hypothetical protein